MSRNSQIKVIAVVGATAGGKTAYSIELAKKLGGEIVSADSRLVYKGFNIGTAKPAPEEMEGIPHHLIDIAEPDFDYSAGLYKKQASEIIEQIAGRGRIPIVAGGTGLYIDVLLRNFNLPQIKPDRQLRERLKLLDNGELHNTLAKLDSEAAAEINPNDRKKIIRAVEIIKTAGKPLNQSRGMKDSIYDIEWIGRNFDREILYERIDKRVDLMLESGLVEETKYLLNKYGRIPNLAGTIGYREIIGYLDNLYSLEEASELLKKNTRNYAKRQLTWFRRNNDIKWNVYPDKLKK